MRSQVLNNMAQALRSGGYSFGTHVFIGKRFNGKKHYIDILAKDNNGNEYLICLRYQEVSGTTEQKVPYEVICLADAIHKQPARKAYLVLAGPGWTLHHHYLSGGLDSHLVHANLVTLKSLGEFIALANQGSL